MRAALAIVAATWLCSGCMGEVDAADLDYAETLDQVADELERELQSQVPPGQRSPFFFDWLKKKLGELKDKAKQAAGAVANGAKKAAGAVVNGAKKVGGAVANKAAQFALCKVLRGNGRDLVYFNGLVAEGSLVGVHGFAGREFAYDLTNYQASAFHFKGAGIATVLGEVRGGAYAGAAGGKHNSVLDMLGPRMSAGIEFGLPILSSILNGSARYLRVSNSGASLNGASVGIKGGLSISKFFLPGNFRGGVGWWQPYNEGTSNIAQRDSDLGARLKNLDSQCASAGKMSYVQYGTDDASHTTRAKAMAKAIVRSAKFDPVAWAMVPMVTALGIARDRGGVAHLCDGAPQQTVPMPATPSCPQYAPKADSGDNSTSSGGTSSQKPSGNGQSSTPGSGSTSSGPDTTAPTVKITSPSAGAKLWGTTTIIADAKDDVGVSKVEFYVDGKLEKTLTSKPYAYMPTLTEGKHQLRVLAYDAAKNEGKDSASVTRSSYSVAKGSPIESGAAASGGGQSGQNGQSTTPQVTGTIQGACSVDSTRLSDGFPASTLALLGLLLALRRRTAAPR